MTPLTVPEARAILVADEALQLTFEAREAAGQTLGLAEGDAWIKLVESAKHRIVGWDRLTVVPTPPTPYPGGNEPDFQTLFVEAMAASKERKTKLSVLACREGSSWVVQAIEEDVASQGDSLLGALADLGRMFDVRDHVLATEGNIAPNPRAPAEYAQALSDGHLVGVLALGAARDAQVYIGISPFERRTS
jgi:hypothetical protein